MKFLLFCIYFLCESSRIIGYAIISDPTIIIDNLRWQWKVSSWNPAQPVKILPSLRNKFEIYIPVILVVSCNWFQRLCASEITVFEVVQFSS